MKPISFGTLVLHSHLFTKQWEPTWRLTTSQKHLKSQEKTLCFKTFQKWGQNSPHIITFIPKLSFCQINRLNLWRNQRRTENKADGISSNHQTSLKVKVYGFQISHKRFYKNKSSRWLSVNIFTTLFWSMGWNSTWESMSESPVTIHSGFIFMTMDLQGLLLLSIPLTHPRKKICWLTWQITLWINSHKISLQTMRNWNARVINGH